MAKGLGLSDGSEFAARQYPPKPRQKPQPSAKDHAPQARNSADRYRQDAKADMEGIWKRVDPHDRAASDRAVEDWKRRWRQRTGSYGLTTDDDVARVESILDDILDDGSDNW